MSERKKHIAVLKEMLEWMNMSSEVIKKDDPFFIIHEHRKKAVKYAISSLETDEAYQLEYEKTTTKDDHHKQNIQAYAHDFGVSEEQAEKELQVTTKNDLAVDCISRADARSLICEIDIKHQTFGMSRKAFKDLYNGIDDLPSVTPQEPRKGEWLRMSDLSEQEDYRYKCSRCGNVINHKSKMDLYTFNSWCGRCGSDNGRKIEVEG